MRLSRTLNRGTTILVLLASIVPFALIGPQLMESHRQFARAQQSAPLAAPTVALSAAQLARWTPLPEYANAVPVIEYHGIDTKGDPLAVSRAGFAEQMAMLSRLGFHAISIDQYVRFRRSEPQTLPPRPILITFDGGRLDSFRGADRTMQRYGYRAAMYASPGVISERKPEYLTWKELASMEATGRWSIQPSGAQGADRVATDAHGHMGGAYAYRRYTRSGGEESYADWQERVTSDVFNARSAMIAQGFNPISFAVPAGDYGRAGSNDDRIAPFMENLLGAQFAVAFSDDTTNDPPYTTATGEAERYRIGASSGPDRLFAWLRANDPTRPAPPVAHPKRARHRALHHSHQKQVRSKR